MQVELSVLGVVVALVVVLLTLIFFSRSSRKRGNTVLIAGPPGGGKTCIFVQLRDGLFPETHTSMQVMDSQLSLEKKQVRVVAFPGHARLRAGLRDYLPLSRWIIFVVDSVNLPAESTQYADYLFDLLTHSHTAKGNVSLLIACNKQDAPQALPIAYVKKTLEKELDKLRKTRSSLRDQEDEGENTFLGIEGEAFDFSHAPCPVTLCSCSAKENKLDDIRKFICSD